MSHQDEKAYWGRIAYEPPQQQQDEKEEDDGNVVTKDDSAPSPQASGNDDGQTETTTTKRIEVRGSVLDGWGLEPEPVSRFIMREKTEEDDLDLLEEDEEDDDDEEDGNFMDLNVGEDDAEPDGLLDWSNSFE